MTHDHLHTDCSNCIIRYDVDGLKQRISRLSDTVEGNGKDGLKQDVARLSAKVSIILWLLGANAGLMAGLIFTVIKQ